MDNGRIYVWRASDASATLLQTLDGENDEARLGTALLATGRLRVFDEFFTSAPFGARDALRMGKASFDTESLDFRVTWSPAAPSGVIPSAFARGDFDGSGALDLVVGVPEDSGEPRGAVGGFFEVFRRTDDGQWAEWGRYRQGE